MACGVVCCGCGKGLAKNGGMTSVVLPPGGVGELAGFIVSPMPEDLQFFETVAEVDRAAQAAGWQVSDTKGANHRCPDCKGGRGSKRRGAYVYRP